MTEIKGLKRVSNATKKHFANNTRRMPIYYNSVNNTVYAKEGEYRTLIGYALNENEPEHIEQLVNDWLWR